MSPGLVRDEAEYMCIHSTHTSVWLHRSAQTENIAHAQMQTPPTASPVPFSQHKRPLAEDTYTHTYICIYINIYNVHAPQLLAYM